MILKVVYKANYDDHGTEIEDEALLRAYAKPLLVALMLSIVSAKLRAFAAAVRAPGLSPADRSAISDGITQLRDRIAARADGDRLAFVRNFIRTHGAAVSLFQDGGLPAPDDPRYRPLSSVPADRVSAEPSLTTSGVPELASAIGILGHGDSEGAWTVGLSSTPGVLTVTAPSGAAPVLFAANATTAARLYSTGAIDSTATDVVVVYSEDVPGALPRSPAGPYGRSLGRKPREVGMGDLLSQASSATDLFDSFRRAAAL
jgi:hypothetical protein